MPRFDVTPALSETIKTLRAQNKIQAKALATLVGKSPSYISKLEKNEIKTIDSKELEAILHLIAGSEENFQKILESILDVLELKYSKKEIDNQLWFQNFDTALRHIPIPKTLIDELNSIKSDLNITIEYLCNRINSNEELSSDVDNIDKYPFNEWQACVIKNRISYTFIKMKVDINEIYGIFDYTTIQSNYITLLAITYYLLKIKNHKQTINISPEESKLLMDNTINMLTNHKFLSILEKRHLINNSDSLMHNDFLSSHDKLNNKLILSILQQLQFFSEYDVLKANDCLSKFENNLNWDAMFMLSLLKLPFHKLEDLNFTEKKELFSSISNLIKLSLENHKTKHTTEFYE